VLGLGLATLVASKQNALIQVGNVDGVRIGGLLLQAGPPAGSIVSPALIQWGAPGSTYAGDAAAPGFLQDVFARVGGPDGASSSPVGATTMIEINNGNVIGCVHAHATGCQPLVVPPAHLAFRTLNFAIGTISGSGARTTARPGR
jgi:hypothetical protein